jgi:Ca2+-binding RTX toxin-like protein
VTATLALAAVAVLSLPAISRAGTIEVKEELAPPGGLYNHAELYFHDDGAEPNGLSVALIPSTVSEHYAIEVVDSASPLVAGRGCQGGGAAGAPATCLVHEPKGAQQEVCGRDCARYLPGTGWSTSLRFHLGDGDNLFRTKGFTNSTIVGFEVETGTGNDQIETTAHKTTVVASATPGGTDLYRLEQVDGFGPGLNTITYRQRDVPIALNDSVVHSGDETDTLVGAIGCVQGGSGQDSLVGGPGEDCLKGGPGDDAISGAAGSDYLIGQSGNDVLSGGEGDDVFDDDSLAESSDEFPIAGEGDDTYYGGAGDDTISNGSGDDVAYGGSGFDQIEGGSGNDVAYGGDGADLLVEGSVLYSEGGDDLAYGGSGPDALHMGPGNDRGYGGPGNDRLYGGGGADALRGGQGADLLIANKGTDGSHRDSRDLLDCGPDLDKVVADPWDRERHCETVVVPAARPKR